MATKTSEDAAAGTTAAQHDDETAQGVETAAQDTAGKAETGGATVAEGTEEAAEGTLAEETADGPVDDPADGFEDDTADAKAPSGVGQGAGARPLGRWRCRGSASTLGREVERLGIGREGR